MMLNRNAFTIYTILYTLAGFLVHFHSAVMLIRVTPRTTRQYKFLKSLQSDKGGLRMQFWRHPDQINRHVDILITRKSFRAYKTLLSIEDLPYKIISRDIVRELGEPSISMNNIEDYDGIYQKADDVISEIRRLGAMYKEEVTVDVIGKSYEGQPIHRALVHLNASDPKPIVFVLCGSHAREWLSVASCQYLLRKLVFDQKYDVEIRNLLQHHDVTIIPLLNPDGYRYTAIERMWRKSRSKTEEKQCPGVDINRNFGYRWGDSGASIDPCDDDYCGEKPFSEPETLALARHVYRNRRNIEAFLDVHTFGQLLMRPWGYTTDDPRDRVRHDYTVKRIKNAVQKKNGARYRVGGSASVLTALSGTALDWMYGSMHVVHSYATELRPQAGVSYNGFEENGREIVPTGEDVLVAVKTLSQLIQEEKDYLRNEY